MKLISQAAENNKAFIGKELARRFGHGKVIEIGSGTGQHGLHVTATCPRLTWQCSETPENLGRLIENMEPFISAKLPAPIRLEVGQSWPAGRFDHAFSANVLHIMSESLMPDFFAGVSRLLAPGGSCCIYGPFKYRGEFTTKSNARFDVWLKQNHEAGGIRDIEVVNELAAASGLSLVDDVDMPANNQLLAFKLAS